MHVVVVTGEKLTWQSHDRQSKSSRALQQKNTSKLCKLQLTKSDMGQGRN